MQRLLAVFTILLVGSIYAQTIGGTTGPCSALAIPPPYNKQISIFGSNFAAQKYLGNCVSSSVGVVWYTISPPSEVDITLSTCMSGTTFDTVISIYTPEENDSCSSLSCYAFNNDDSSCSSSNMASTIKFASSGNVTYYIGVGGFGSSTGTFQLLLTQTNTSGANNPGCSNATPIEGPYNPAVNVNGNNAGGITGINEMVNTSCQIYPYQFSSWYQIFPSYGKYVNVTTCNYNTYFDTVLTVVTGEQCSSLDCTARNDDGCYNTTKSTVKFFATAESYYVIVSGYSSFYGSFQLSVFQEDSGSSSATSCSNAAVIYPSNSYNGSTIGIPASVFVDACSRYSNRKSAVWFHLQNLPTNSSVTLSTCNPYTNFDTVILVYGGSCSSLTCVAYNDDSSCSNGISASSTVVFYPTTSSYFVVVAALSSVTGDFLLTVS